jgi:hypothetical protein
LTLLVLLPALLSLLVLAAHFLRAGSLAFVLICLALSAATLVRRPWACRLLQGVLLLGCAEWLRTLAGRVAERTAVGAPWLRMALILGSVALVAAISALALESAPARGWFRKAP